MSTIASIVVGVAAALAVIILLVWRSRARAKTVDMTSLTGWFRRRM